MGDRQWFVLYVLVCLEVGVFLMLVPWSVVWERNYFLQLFPELTRFVLHPVTRGAVSGLGVANLYVGLGEVVRRRAVLDAQALDRAASSEPSFGSRDAGHEALVTHEKRT